MKVLIENKIFEKYKSKIDKINRHIVADIKKTNIDCDSISIYWSHKKFQKELKISKYIPNIEGGKVFAIVRLDNKRNLRVYLDDKKLQRNYTIDFFRFAFLHEIAHFLIEKQGQIYIEDIKQIQIIIDKFTKEKKELKNAINFLNYIINDTKVDLNFIEKYPWSRSIFLKANTFMLKHYTNKNIYKFNTESKLNCLVYLINASRFFIPIKYMKSTKHLVYNKLLSYFKGKNKTEILTFNKQLSYIIKILYKDNSKHKIPKIYLEILLNLDKIYHKCFN